MRELPERSAHGTNRCGNSSMTLISMPRFRSGRVAERFDLASTFVCSDVFPLDLFWQHDIPGLIDDAGDTAFPIGTLLFMSLHSTRPSRVPPQHIFGIRDPILRLIVRRSD